MDTSRKSQVLLKARDFTTRVAWKVAHNADYLHAYHHGYLREVYAFLRPGSGPQLETLDEEIIADAAKYPTKMQWKNASKLYGQARKSRRGDLFARATSHMVHEPHIQPFKYSDEELINAAKPFKTRIAWKKGDRKTYGAAVRRNLMDRACSHMTLIGNRRYYTWQVYAYSWDTIKTAYIGITGRGVKRHDRSGGHGLRGPVFDFAKKHGEPRFQVLYYPVTMDEAPGLETKCVEGWRRLGWTMLNTAKPGSRGSVDRKWTQDRILEDALRYKSKTGWVHGSQSAYNAAHRLGIFDRACAHMVRPKREIHLGTDRVISEMTRAKMSEAAKKRASSQEWCENHSKALKGRALTDKHRAKIGAANKGKGRGKGWTLSNDELDHLKIVPHISAPARVLLTDEQRSLLRRYRYNRDRTYPILGKVPRVKDHDPVPMNINPVTPMELFTAARFP